MSVSELINIFQLIANAFALGTAGVLYVAYIQSLRSQIDQKEEKSQIIEKNLQFWKDKAGELEKKTPDFIVRSLADRIKVSEEEIGRLLSDKESNKVEIEKKNELLSELRTELEKAKTGRKSLEEVSFEDSYDMEEIGSVSVDSGQLLITDPCYIDSEWSKEEFEDIRLYKDKKTKRILQFRKDFQMYTDVIDGYTKDVNTLIRDGDLEEVEIKGKLSYSYNGAAQATLSEEGYGSLKFKLGHEGAGFAFRTLYGDGDYPVYGEKIDDKLVRVTVDLGYSPDLEKLFDSPKTKDNK
jgi:hypothetical protein